MAGNLGTLTVYLTANTNKFNKRIKESQRRVGEMKSAISGMSTVATAALASFGAVAVSRFADFEKQMRNVNTIGRQVELQYTRTLQSVLKLSVEFGSGAVDLSTALYNINSASFTATAGLNVLRAATVAAKAGVTDATTAAKGITGILNAYGKGSKEAGNVSDILFKTVERGVLTFEELSSSIGTVVATASAAKVPFSQVSAALATITRGGIDAAEATTALNRLFMTFLKAPTELDNAFKDLGQGFEGAGDALRKLGFVDTVKLLGKVTDGSAEKLAQMGFEIRAAKAIFSLTRNELKDFSEDVSIFTNKAEIAGATSRAFGQQSLSLAQGIAKVKASLELVAIEFGQRFSPIVQGLGNRIQFVVHSFSGLNSMTKNALVRIAAVTVGVGSLALAMKLLHAGAIVRGIVAIGTYTGVMTVKTAATVKATIATWNYVTATAAMTVASKTAVVAEVAKTVALHGVKSAAFGAAKALGAVAAAAAVAFVGWNVGKWIAEVTGLNKKIEELYNWFIDLESIKKPGEQAGEIIKQIDKFNDALRKTKTMSEGDAKNSYLAKLNFEYDKLVRSGVLSGKISFKSMAGIDKKGEKEKVVPAYKTITKAEKKEINEIESLKERYAKRLEQFRFSQLTTEQKLNHLIARRNILLAITGSTQKQELNRKLSIIDLEERISGFRDSQDRKIKDIESRPGERFSGALEKGSVDAYRAELSNGQNKLESNTKLTASNTKKMYEEQKKTNAIIINRQPALGVV